ncbi:hypothetical protein RKD23_004288 [Streptomyces sp. SAI-170]
MATIEPATAAGLTSLSTLPLDWSSVTASAREFVHRVEDLHAELVEALVALGGPEVDHAQDRVVLAPELQETVDEFLCRLPAGLADPAAAREQFGQPGALGGHLLGDLQDGALDVREVLIEGRGRSARFPGDIDDLDVPVGRGAEHLTEAVQQLLPRGLPTPTGHAAVNGTHLSCHAVSLPRGDGSAIRPTANGVPGGSKLGVPGLRAA